MPLYEELPWHDGEQQMQQAMHTARLDNPTFPALSPQLATHLQIAPLLAIGALDTDGRPWTTVWGGERGISQPMGGDNIVGIRTPVAGKHDPVIQALLGEEPTSGAIVREESEGRMISGLTLDLETRKRVKLFGRMIAGALTVRNDDVASIEERVTEIQLVVRIEQALGNCPKYLNKKSIAPAVSKAELISDSTQLPERACKLIEKADLFFISSSRPSHDMDTNHRGGPQGFLRLASNDASGAILYWPEYSGNRLYQTLGNLKINPLAGLSVPDFNSGDMLYLTGVTEILFGADAAAVLPRSNLCVKLRVTSSRLVAQALPFRGRAGETSPYNPAVRYLTSEKAATGNRHITDAPTQQARLLKQVTLTPNISRFHFALEKPARYFPGQYVMLDFSQHLDIGYSHMRDDDPRSLNDDYVRTFTVSNSPAADRGKTANTLYDEFDITIRKVGVATDFLFRHDSAKIRRGLEIGVKGFGGEFEVKIDGEETVGFVGAGIGITPLLPSLGSLDLNRLRLFWSIREEDIGLVEDLMAQHPRLCHSTDLFVTDAKHEHEQLRRQGVSVHTRRMQQSDLEYGHKIDKYYLCTGVPMRQQITEWLPEKRLIFEDFNF